MQDIKMIRLTAASNSTVIAFSSLISQLDGQEIELSKEQIEDVIQSDNVIIFLAEQNGKTVGFLTLVIYRIITGLKASIEDVVVDIDSRGKGLGEFMLNFTIDYAKNMGITKLDLTSRPSRVAANALYRKVGFEQRETNVYRIEL